MARQTPATRGFRDQQRRALGLGLLASLGLHALVIVGAGRIAIPSSRSGSAEIRIVVLEPFPVEMAEPAPPRIGLPPPPPEVVRPGRPIAAPDPPPIESEPTYIAHDIVPRLVNGDAVREVIRDRVPPRAQPEPEVGHVVLLWLFVDRSGEVRRLRLRRSSGSDDLDRIAQSAARTMKFRPAFHMGDPVGVWVAQQIRFTTDGARGGS